MIEVRAIRLNCQSVEVFVMITWVLDMQTRLEGCSHTVKSKRVGDGRLYNDEQGARDTTKQWNARGWERAGYIMKDMRLERQPNSSLLDGGSRTDVVMIYGLGDLIDN